VSSLTLKYAQFEPQFALAPSVDVFIIKNLSIGATLGFSFNQLDIGFGGGKSNVTTIFFMPRVGYNIPIINRFSFWPQVGIGIGIAATGGNGANTTEAMVPLDVFVPFCFHPIENFFMGVGPAIRFYSLDDKTPGITGTIVNVDFLRFTLACSVPVF
jgi:hypothetical protein